MNRTILERCAYAQTDLQGVPGFLLECEDDLVSYFQGSQALTAAEALSGIEQTRISEVAAKIVLGQPYDKNHRDELKGLNEEQVVEKSVKAFFTAYHLHHEGAIELNVSNEPTLIELLEFNVAISGIAYISGVSKQRLIEEVVKEMRTLWAQTH